MIFQEIFIIFRAELCFSPVSILYEETEAVEQLSSLDNKKKTKYTIAMI